jgi:hypothetical protein
MQNITLWKSSKKDGFELTILCMFVLYGLYVFVRDGFSWVNLVYALFVGTITFYNAKTYFVLQAKEKEINSELLKRGYKSSLVGATSIFGDSRQFSGFVYKNDLYNAVSKFDEYSVNLVEKEGVDFYIFYFLQSNANWVAVVDGRDVQYFVS